MSFVLHKCQLASRPGLGLRHELSCWFCKRYDLDWASGPPERLLCHCWLIDPLSWGHGRLLPCPLAASVGGLLGLECFILPFLFIAELRLPFQIVVLEAYPFYQSFYSMLCIFFSFIFQYFLLLSFNSLFFKTPQIRSIGR